MADSPKRTNTINSVLRALDVLRHMEQAGHATLGVTEIASALDMPKAAIYRILSSLLARGFVDFDEVSHRYRLGSELLVLGEAYRSRIDVRDVAAGELNSLMVHTNETATLSICEGGRRIYIDQVYPDRDVRMMVRIGRGFPLHAGASSKAFLAFLPDEVVDACMDDLTELTENTITSEADLRSELAEIRERGFATSSGERQPGARSIAAPVFGLAQQSPIAVISVSGPADRFDPMADDVGSSLLEACARVSTRLGGNRG